jgi:hypothetical protein
MADGSTWSRASTSLSISVYPQGKQRLSGVDVILDSIVANVAVLNLRGVVQPSQSWREEDAWNTLRAAA